MQLSQKIVANLQAQVGLFNKMIMHELQGQVTRWKHKATKVVVGVNEITQATPICFLTIFVIVLGKYS